MAIDAVQNFFNTTVTIKWNSTGSGNFYIGQLPTVENGYLVINRSSPSKREIIKYTGTGTDGNGPYVTIAHADDRGLGGTTAQTHEIGETVQMTLTAEHWSDLDEAIESIISSGAPTASTTIKGISKLSAAPTDPDDPIAVGVNDPKLPAAEPDTLYVRQDALIDESTGVADAGKGVKTGPDGKIDKSLRSTFIKREYTASELTPLGDSTSQYDVSTPSGVIRRYTYDGTGTNPNITSSSVPVGSFIYIPVISASNNNSGTYRVVNSGTNFFEVINPDGSSQNNGTAQIYLVNHTIWTKPANLQRILLRMWSGGGSGKLIVNTGTGSVSGGGGGAYWEGWINAEDLAATENICIGQGGAGLTVTTTTSRNGHPGVSSIFGSHVNVTGGKGGENNSVSGGALLGFPTIRPLYGQNSDVSILERTGYYSGSGARGNDTGGKNGGDSVMGGGGGGGTGRGSGNNPGLGGKSIFAGNGSAGNLVTDSGSTADGEYPSGGSGAIWSFPSTTYTVTVGKGGDGKVELIEYYN